MSNPWSWIPSEISKLKSATLDRSLRRRESPPVAGRIQLDGRQLLNLGSNDYLGLAADSRVVDAVKRFAGYHGWGSGASPLVNGRGTLHETLEQQLAVFEGTESALLFPSGFSANMGVISALLDRHSVVFSDEKNHASIIDGIRLSRAQKYIYRHVDVNHLEELLKSQTAATRKLIVTDSLFSMDGNLAPLSKIAQLADQYGAMLIIDEAHATGVYGPKGQGIHELVTFENAPLIIGTLSKAIGSIGGFAAGPQSVIEWLWNRARSYMFSTATPEVTCAATLAALEIVRTEPHRRIELLETANWLREQLNNAGWNTALSTSQIIPIVVGDAKQAQALSQRLLDQGFFVPVIRPPAVPTNSCLLRISLSWQHQRQDLKSFLDVLGRAAELSP
jgi:8-amino-7-oxononanoate synthase